MAAELLMKRNAAYGSGIFRRRIRLLAEAGSVFAGLEDTNHAMGLVLRHDGARVTAIESRMQRVPLSTCAGAAVPLRAFVGAPLAPYPSRPSDAVDARMNCTHLHHLALLAIAHACRGGGRQYDVEVPDEHPDPVWSVVRRDGGEVHRWRTLEGRILEPAPLAGSPMAKGFARWAAARFDGDDLEAAFVFSGAYMVSFIRRYDTRAWTGHSAASQADMAGKCHSYQPEVARAGVYLAREVRDTTAVDTPLLADFPGATATTP
jgi:hypothetical protein